MLSEQEDHDTSQGLHHAIASTIMYKTVGAPYSRLQCILQNQTYMRNIGILPESLKNINSTQISLGTLASFFYHNEGMDSWFRGHSMTLLKAIGNTLLSHFVKPLINSRLGLPSHGIDKPQSSTNEASSNDNSDHAYPVSLSRQRSLNDPELANTEVPALIDMITRHQSNMNVNTSVNVAPRMFVAPKSKVNTRNDNENENNENDNMNRNDNMNENRNRDRNVNDENDNGMMDKIGKFCKKHIAREIYPLVSFCLLYPLNVFQTYYWLDLKGSSSNGNNEHTFTKGYYACYKSLGGGISFGRSFNVLYGGMISAALGVLVYRQTYFNMYHIIDWILYKITGRKHISVDLIKNTTRRASIVKAPKKSKEEETEEEMFKLLNQSLRGIITTNIAMFMAFPFHVIKYRMILSKHPNSNIKYNGYFDCISQTISNEGYKTFFNGATANLILGAVATVALITIDAAKMAQSKLRENERKQKIKLRAY